jgi:maleylacetate reductase
MTLPEARWREGFTYDAPVLADRTVRVVFGVGSVHQVGREAAALGRQTLLIAGQHEDAAADLVAAQLGVDLAGRLRDVAQHVPTHLADEATHHATQLGAQVLLTIGGGSATGLAKAIALRTGLPILAVPTTYAGSEMTPIWGLTDPQGKTTGRDRRVLPRTVLYDPALTVSLPPQMTGASGMNALAHALEALYAPDTTPLLSMLAEEALRTLGTALPMVVAQPDDLDARSQLLFGAWLAGWALGSTTMGLHHKLAHVLGGTYRLPHAGVHSTLLPQVAAFNATAAPEAFTRAARALHAGDPGDVGQAVFDLATRVGAPTSLADLGLAPDAIDAVAAVVAAATVVNPRPVTEPDLVHLLRAAFAGTRPETSRTREYISCPDPGSEETMTDTPTDLGVIEAQRRRIRHRHLRPTAERPRSTARTTPHRAVDFLPTPEGGGFP